MNTTGMRRYRAHGGILFFNTIHSSEILCPRELQHTYNERRMDCLGASSRLLAEIWSITGLVQSAPLQDSGLRQE